MGPFSTVVRHSRSLSSGFSWLADEDRYPGPPPCLVKYVIPHPNDRQAELDRGARRNDRALGPRFNACKTALHPWSCSLSQVAAGNAIIHTGKALKAGRQPHRVGFPQYRKRGRHRSHAASNGRDTVRPDGAWVRLPAVGRAGMRESLWFDGDVVFVTVETVRGAGLLCSRWIRRTGNRPSAQAGPAQFQSR